MRVHIKGHLHIDWSYNANTSCSIVPFFCKPQDLWQQSQRQRPNIGPAKYTMDTQEVPNLRFILCQHVHSIVGRSIGLPSPVGTLLAYRGLVAILFITRSRAGRLTVTLPKRRPAAHLQQDQDCTRQQSHYWRSCLLVNLGETFAKRLWGSLRRDARRFRWLFG